MRTLTVVGVAMVAIATGRGAASAQPAADEAAVRAVVARMAHAFDHNDPDLLDSLTTADYTFVTPVGTIQTKAERLAPMRSGLLHYASANYDEITVRVHGATAVVTARVVARSAMGSVDTSGTFRATLVLIRVQNRWLVAASHVSTIAQPAG